MRLTGKLNGSEKTYPFAGTLAAMRDDGRNAFIARLWAARRIGELIDELDLNGRNEELIRELVQLSTKHGILTPYTSFLADENVKPELVSVRNLERASGNLNALSEADGSFGFAQRGVKQLLKNADMAPAPAAALPTGNHPGVPEEFRARKDAETIGREAVLQAKTNTLYRRGKLIVTPETAALDLAKDQSQYQVIERFTPEYFRLVAANSPSDNELLARQNDDEELLVQLRGANYLIK